MTILRSVQVYLCKWRIIMVENILIVIFTVLMLGGSILGFRLERGGEDEKEK